MVSTTNFELNYNTPNKLPMKDLKLNNNIKALALNTSTEFEGNTVYIECSNGSSYNVQSNYTYNSINNITHTLEWTVDNNNETWTIYSPLYWNYTLITPSEIVDWNTTTDAYNFTGSNGDTTYIMSFYSGEGYGIDYARQNQYLCINNANYLDYTDYWVNLPDPPKFDSLTLNSTVYFSGNDSFRLEDTDAQTEAIVNTPMNLATGSYYFSMCYFVDYWSAGTISFNYYGLDSVWHLTNFDITENKRWKRLFLYAEVQQGGLYELAFSSLSGTGVILIDNFQSWQITNTMANTDIINQFNISSTVITWDLHKNYGINGVTTNYDIRNRCGDYSLNTTALTTNTVGYSSYLYTNATLDTSELEIRTYNLDNWFGSPWGSQDITETDVALFAPGSIYSSDSQIGDYSIEINATTSFYDFAGTLDFSTADYYRVFIKSVNKTSTPSHRHRFFTSAPNLIGVIETTDLVQNVWYNFTWEITNDFTEVGGNFDLTSVDYLGWGFGGLAQWRLDGLRAFQAQKKFYQPKTTNNHLYYHQTLDSLDEWDFKEGYIEGFDDYQNRGNQSVNDGGLETFDIGAYTTIWLRYNSNPINADYYNRILFRIKTNKEDIRLEVLDSIAPVLSNITLSSSFEVYDYLLDNIYWTGDETVIYLRFDEGGISNFDGDEIIIIDYIRLYHKDTPILKQTLTENWFLTSQNDSYTYSWSTTNLGTSTTTDLTHNDIRVGGGITLSHTAYLDSNYNDSLLLPSETFTTDFDFVVLKNDFIPKLALTIISLLGMFMLFMGLILIFRMLFGNIFRK
jgi:hypothetical protein